MPSSCRKSVLLLALAVWLGAGPSRAIEFFCNPVDMCAWVPTDGQGDPVYNHTDPDLPWVIGGNEEVSLPAGDYTVGNGVLGVPMVFVIENGSLLIEDTGDEEVGLGAWIILCDQASFTIRNATFRLLQDFGFQYPLFALGRSRVEYEDVTIYALKRELHAIGARGAFLQTMGYDSTLIAQPGASHGVHLPVLGEPWELAVVHRATADIRSVEAFGEFYIQGEAVFSVADTRYHDMFFEVCAGDDYTLADLPALCDPFDPVDGCVTGGHQPIDFHLGPPDTPFSLTLTNDKLFAWAVSNYPGSTTRLARIPRLANFGVGLGGIATDMELYLRPGDPSTIEGLDDRTFELDEAIISGFHLWPVGDSFLRLLPGSVVGDLLPSDQASADAEGVTFAWGMFRSNPGQEIWLKDSDVREDVENLGGKLWALTTTFDSPMRLDGPTWLADSDWPDAAILDMREQGVLYRVALTAPAEGTQLSGDPVDIRGDVRAEDANGPLDPFPATELEVVALADDSQVFHRELDIQGNDGLLATWDPTGLDPGDYQVRLWFAGEDGARAPSVRTVILPGDPGPDGGQDDGGRDGGDAQADEDMPDAGRDAGTGQDAGADDEPGGNAGCGCGLPGPATSLPWALLVLAAWLRRRLHHDD